MTNALFHVREGMSVLDRNGKKIGSVDWVKMTDENPDTAASEQITADTSDQHNVNLIDIVADAFRVDEVPDELRKRLLREGFVRIAADGVFASDRYVLPDQIAIVSDQKVFLDVDRESLIKRH